MGQNADQPRSMQKSAWEAVRTTLDLNDDLLAEAKALAASEKLTLTRLIEEGLALRLLQNRRAAAAHTPVPLPVYPGRGGLSSAVVNPGSNRALLDATDDLRSP